MIAGLVLRGQGALCSVANGHFKITVPDDIWFLIKLALKEDREDYDQWLRK